MIGEPLPVTSWKSFVPSAAIAVAACARRAPGIQKLVAAIAAPRTNWRREYSSPFLITLPNASSMTRIGAEGTRISGSKAVVRRLLHRDVVHMAKGRLSQRRRRPRVRCRGEGAIEDYPMGKLCR